MTKASDVGPLGTTNMTRMMVLLLQRLFGPRDLKHKLTLLSWLLVLILYECRLEVISS